MVDKQVHKDALPNYAKARIPAEKLRDYCLDLNNPKGASKARVFKSILGFERQHWEQLSDIIKINLAYYPALKKEVSKKDGEKWTVDIPVVGLNRNLAVVTTGWMFKSVEPDTPILITCFIAPRKQKELKRQLGLELEEK